ncbi:hypothetical protein HZH68_004015 [Vespula germanica]|uniref:Phosphatidylserine decarboxylase proenzyme, mitochondrial n=1 Tax=Vespula germanica TaxID=30212 RepID=A0A836XMM8_VESGE|nr:hypothetical protein HZH68_004015 [Vespula germanica]
MCALNLNMRRLVASWRKSPHLRLLQHGRKKYDRDIMHYSKYVMQFVGEQRMLSRNISHATSNQTSIGSKISAMRKLKLVVPIGIGVSLIAFFQWRHFRKYKHTAQGEVIQGPLNDFIVNCYCCLPLRITSRIWGWIANREVPVSLRPGVYQFYAKIFNANLEEVAGDLSGFPTLVDFFVRPLKEETRPIAKDTNMVSPSDGTVLHFGPVTSCRVEQVKGMTYDLRHFLGDIDLQESKEKIIYTEEDNKKYVKSLLKNPMNQLYQITVYLAPGDYHRFHSPTDWEIEFRRHFQGKLLSVNPKIARFLPDLFSLNERVVYIGKWAEGFMAYAAVGATNVGSIKIYCDKELTTNKIIWPKMKRWEDASLECTHISKGQLFGEFRMGSTIVLLFEAPEDFQFCLNVGQTIKVGQALSECIVKSDEKYLSGSL